MALLFIFDDTDFTKAAGSSTIRGEIVSASSVYAFNTGSIALSRAGLLDYNSTGSAFTT